MVANKRNRLPVAEIILSLICIAFFPTIQAAQMRIVGGENVKPNEITYQASLRVYGQHVCGGTIISSKHILTAAHCLDGLGFEAPYDDISVITGTLRLLDTRNEKTISNITIHKDFINEAEKSYINDIAIITLEDEIEFDQTQAPAKLPIAPISNGLSGTVIGWGRQDAVNPYLSKVLKKATLQVLTPEQCQPKMNFTIYEGHICGMAGKKTGICKGDSGGPFVVNNTVIGISSWNVACDGSGGPDVFTNVYKYLDFINDVIGKNF